jgi:four helix bundle protein
MEIFELTKKFPKEETYSLTDQIRRASRSVCSNLSEGWRKRRYKAVFLNKLTDSGQEAAETQTWLEFSLHCKYIDEETFRRLDDSYEHVFAMLSSMEKKADTFCRTSSERSGLSRRSLTSEDGSSVVRAKRSSVGYLSDLCASNERSEWAVKKRRDMTIWQR